MKRSERVFLCLIILVFDVVVFFLPLAAILIAYVVLARPPWFPAWVERVYRDPA